MVTKRGPRTSGRITDEPYARSVIVAWPHDASLRSVVPGPLAARWSSGRTTCRNVHEYEIARNWTSGSVDPRAMVRPWNRNPEDPEGTTTGGRRQRRLRRRCRPRRHQAQGNRALRGHRLTGYTASRRPGGGILVDAVGEQRTGSGGLGVAADSISRPAPGWWRVASRSLSGS